ncbi:uncharacterized protein TNCV_3585991 [Trichonephila clavipes]|nr:uncharacterized protein TNCV_3585991 [Trichonephila clavipes]
MPWNRKNDILSCEVDLSIEMTEPFTRRKKAKLGWDDELPKDVTEKFKKWFKNLHLLKLVEIPRYMSMNNCVSISLHIFCDASKFSYAKAIFLRSESESQVSVQLVLAKSRITPLKAMSITKLELMACTTGIRLTDMVKKALSIKDIVLIENKDKKEFDGNSTALYTSLLKTLGCRNKKECSMVRGKRRNMLLTPERTLLLPLKN